jgi:ABC-type phosphate transport system auxiliary subunit
MALTMLQLVALLGVCLVIAGTGLIYYPAALIVAGGFLLFFAYTEG